MTLTTRMFVVVAGAALLATALGETVGAQNPPSQGMRWSKAAPFPEPEEELYGSVINGKLYVVGGFGYNPNVGQPAAANAGQPAPNAGRGGAPGVPNAGRGGAPGAPGAGGGGVPRVPPAFIYEYDAGADKWTKKKTIPVPVHHQAQAVLNGKLYIFGGCATGIGGAGAVTNSWEYDPVADAYKALAPLPGKRCAAIAEQVGGKFYVIGGLEPFEDGTGTRVSGRNDMYDPATNTWTSRSAMPTTRNHAFSGVVNGKIYVIGGRLGAGTVAASSPTDVVEEYDPATNGWALKEKMPTPRSGGGVATYDGKIWVAGGEITNRQLSAAFRALEAYDPVTNTWEIMPTMPSARHGVAAGFIGNKLHLVSGKQEGGGAPDMTGNSTHPYATEAHDVLDIPSGTR